jgi:hypothetical protein
MYRGSIRVIKRRFLFGADPEVPQLDLPDAWDIGRVCVW